jgi:uncharacterized membrane protein YkvA (DUF1232 family)
MHEPAEQRTLIPTLPPGTDRQKARVEAGFWRKVRRLVGRVPFLEEAVAAYYCATDSASPTRVRGVLIAALAYFVIPMDLIPDFIASIGFTDDAAVLLTAIQAVAPHIKDDHRVQARAAVRRLSGTTETEA